MVQELQSYAVSEGEGKYETVVSHEYIVYGINVALAHEGLRRAPHTGKPRMSTSDIKEGKQQTTAELDIYIKDLVKRCQFPHQEVESM